MFDKTFQLILCFSVHCFNNYGKNIDKKCPDLEVRYYIECNEKINKSRKKRSPIVCRTETPSTTVSLSGTKKMLISGDIQINYDYDAYLTDDFYHESAQKDLKELIELSEDVHKADVTIRDVYGWFADYTGVDFIAEVTVSESKSTNEIENSLKNNFENAVFFNYGNVMDFNITVSEGDSSTTIDTTAQPVAETSNDSTTNVNTIKDNSS